jgi:hypothetical protein
MTTFAQAHSPLPTISDLERAKGIDPRLVRRIPLWLKAVYSIFVAVLVPFYVHDYGVSNFLFFCDVALLTTMVAIWTESAVLASAALVGILVPQLLWMADFCTGGNFVHLTNYMFDPGIALFTRFLSFFHFWLPILLLYLVWRLGYDGRGYFVWAVPSCLLLLPVCYFFMPPPHPTNDPNLPANINYVFGLTAGTEEPQHWMGPNLWFALELVALPIGIWLPTHFVLSKLFRKPKLGYTI